MTAAELRARGNAALAQGSLDEARQLYRQAAGADPKDALPWLSLGFVNMETGQWAEAQECLARAIALAKPGDDFLPDAYYLRGRAQQENGARAQALADFQAAVAARPDFAEPMDSAAQVLLDLERYGEALDWAQRAMAARPNPQMELVAAQALDKLDRPAEAVQLLDALLVREPGLAAAIEGRGVMLLHLDRPAEALTAFERVLELQGESARRLSNVAAAMHRLGRFDDAALLARRALLLNPDGRDEAYNLAAVLLEMLRTDEAMVILKRASARYPDDADLGWNLAIGHLQRGELLEGFAAYEHRFLCDAAGWRKPAPVFGRPRWTGRESLAGRSILLFAEQGLGDSIQMLRYLPLVAERASLVLLRLPDAIRPLLHALPAHCRWVSEAEPAPSTDFQCPLMSLPNALGTTLETIPSSVPYLVAAPDRVQAWRERLRRLGGTPRVGVVWSGNASHPNDRNRSIPLEVYRTLAAEGVQFVSLQPEVRPADRPAYEGWAGLARFGEELKDFADTAALVSALDLVISVDTSVVHLTGALGRPLWVLLPHHPDWRWLLDRDDSPWYPTARLWRQPAPRDWPSVLDAVREELERVKGIEPSS